MACGSDNNSLERRATQPASARHRRCRRRCGRPDAAIKLAVNPWDGSAVNANVAKVVLESKLGTPTELVALDENASWVGLDAGDLDANLEIWPSGHAADHKTYIDEKKTVVDIGTARPEGQDRLVRPDVRHRRSTPS